MAAGSTYTPIQTYTVSGSTTDTITFSVIPATYTDLVLVVSSNVISSAGTNMYVRLNSDSGTNYSGTRLDGNGTSASSSRDTNDTRANVGYSNSSGYSTVIANFMNYANTTTYKTIVSRDSNAAALARTIVNLWRNTSAISTIALTCGSAGNYFTAGSTATLYGITAA